MLIKKLFDSHLTGKEQLYMHGYINLQKNETT